jgi:aspartate aminotransferase
MSVIQPSPTLAITAKAKKMQSEGIDVISFAAGEPDFNTPAEICEAAIQAIRNGDTKYAPSAGSIKLREAISQKFARENGLTYGTDQIIVSCGAKHSIYNALQVTINPGDEVILIAPYWMTYAEQIRLAGGIPRVVHTKGSEGFIPDMDELKNAVNGRTKAIILNSPSNPTGATFDRATMKNIAALALRHGLWIIADDIYERLVYGIEHTNIAGLGQDVYNHTITVSGCSKTYSMTGWRIGYAAGPLNVVKAMSNLQDQVTSNATSFAQAGAVAAMNLDPAKIEFMRAEFQSRRDIGVAELKKIPGVETPVPNGAFYLFPDFSQYIGAGNDIDLANEILMEAKVAVIPGGVFEGPGHLRLSYATSPELIQTGIRRIAEYLATKSV